MPSFDDMVRAQRAYRHGVSTLLGMGGIPECIPQTEQEWVLFDTNQKLRDMGLGKPLPWPDTPPAKWTEDEVLDALGRSTGYILASS